MGLFNRYETNPNFVKAAFNEYSKNYCNPKNYLVTEEECRKYVEELKLGQKLNKEWNSKREKRIITAIVVIGILLTLSVPPALFLWLDNQESAWGLPVCIISTWIIIGFFVWLCNVFETRRETCYLDKFFPPVNQNIEKLFDDYLWKEEMDKQCREQTKTI